jgi:hypothetical protein
MYFGRLVRLPWCYGEPTCLVACSGTWHPREDYSNCSLWLLETFIFRVVFVFLLVIIFFILVFPFLAYRSMKIWQSPIMWFSCGCYIQCIFSMSSNLLNFEKKSSCQPWRWCCLVHASCLDV